MSDYYWYGTKLKKEIENLNDISRIKIATAYFSEYGFDLLNHIINKNNLSKNQVLIYLSPEFSKVKPGELLEQLSQIGKVHITYDIPFHPKVVLIEGKITDKLIFGSSNFSGGGIERNIEFDIIKSATDEDKQKLNIFFDFCNNSSKLVTNEMIHEYKDNQQVFDELRRLEREIKKKFYVIILM